MLHFLTQVTTCYLFDFLSVKFAMYVNIYGNQVRVNVGYFIYGKAAKFDGRELQRMPIV